MRLKLYQRSSYITFSLSVIQHQQAKVHVSYKCVPVPVTAQAFNHILCTMFSQLSPRDINL